MIATADIVLLQRGIVIGPGLEPPAEALVGVLLAFALLPLDGWPRQRSLAGKLDGEEASSEAKAAAAEPPLATLAMLAKGSSSPANWSPMKRRPCSDQSRSGSATAAAAAVAAGAEAVGKRQVRPKLRLWAAAAQ
eukprot:CAMPEP_0195024120 /NCGR_PEP_ID=MMETSP0326_2-20130528/44486_1 /TAXON_ID=2866 ORGANISM="Crypthecodinium cohnii, Strain Seligo" /NCGR_SAMPLE_ID=MMETSP0326_2 /ASSEMBLY_ACC=CAM_ASM_000348 /LENGTH=134 /DNA_ID=CAMNT_0040044775 /DNA_START=226 /DNA_END=626 /DNA_ORIENTATION=+